MSQTKIIPLTRDLCRYATGVVGVESEALFERLSKELPFKLLRYRSGSVTNGWTVPQLWKVKKALIKKDGKVLFDGKCHTLAVGMYSKSFTGTLDWEELKEHLVTNPKQPEAHMFHCLWQYRPWETGWAFCVPYKLYKKWGRGRYQVELETSYERGEMLVGVYDHKGASDKTIVFNSNTCHPHQANDSFSGVATFVRLFQWLKGQKTRYSYRLILAPEHLGSVFYLRDRSKKELEKMVSGIFMEMPGTKYPVRATSTYLGKQKIDRAFDNVLRHHCKAYKETGWRQGAGNDETVWEAPGYEVPFVELTRCHETFEPYPEYHSSLDTADRLDPGQVDEVFDILKRVVNVLENDHRVYRKFDGLICLSNPKYDLYCERPDPTIVKDLAKDSEKWGHLLDSLFRYFDGSMTILDIAEKHDLPFERLHQYLTKFEKKKLIDLEFAPIERHPFSRPKKGKRG